MPASVSSECNPRHAVQAFQLPPELVWDNTFLGSRRTNYRQYFRNNSAPAALQIVPSPFFTSADTNSSHVSRIVCPRYHQRRFGGNPRKLCDNQTMCEDAPSADSFAIGDTVAAIAISHVIVQSDSEKPCDSQTMCDDANSTDSFVKGDVVAAISDRLGEGDSEKLCDNQTMCEDAPSADSFAIGDTVTAIAISHVIVQNDSEKLRDSQTMCDNANSTDSFAKDDVVAAISYRLGEGDSEKLCNSQTICEDAPSAESSAIGGTVAAISHVIVQIDSEKRCDNQTMCQDEYSADSFAMGGTGAATSDRLGGRHSEKVRDNPTMPEEAYSAQRFAVGDTVAATSDFNIGGALAVEKGCRGTVMCHGERPDGRMGVSVQFEAWKHGRDVKVLCLPYEIENASKAIPTDSFGTGDTAAATSDFRTVGLQAVEKGHRGTAKRHGKRSDRSSGVSTQPETRKDGSNTKVPCQSHKIHVPAKATHGQPMCEYATQLEHHPQHARESIQAPAVSFSKILPSSPMDFMFENFATRSFSPGTWACTSIILGILAICSFCLFLPSVPVTEKVVIEGAEVYSQMAGGAQLNQCVPFADKDVGWYHRSKTSIIVCGTQTKVSVFLRNNCEEYSSYQHEVGTCNATEASTRCVAVSSATEKGLRWLAQAQSYRIELCSPAARIGFWDMLWQRLLHSSGVRSPLLNDEK